MHSLPRTDPDFPTTSPIQAIETLYAGCRFRSRLEARWAVFFDALGITWDYEPEGFRLPNLPAGDDCYLPDFWLPQVEMYAEVKPSGKDKSIVTIKPQEMAKVIALAMVTEAPVLILDGMPRDTNYWAVVPNSLFDGLDRDVAWMWVDYMPAYPGAYHLTDGRFYASTSGRELAHDWDIGDDAHPAVIAALSARFEHGERP